VIDFIEDFKMSNKTRLQHIHDVYMSLSPLGRERMRADYEHMSMLAQPTVAQRDKVEKENDAAAQADIDLVMRQVKADTGSDMLRRFGDWLNSQS
jgi:NACalpha-BTF3-like transcription factor